VQENLLVGSIVSAASIQSPSWTLRYPCRPALMKSSKRSFMRVAEKRLPHMKNTFIANRCAISSGWPWQNSATDWRSISASLRDLRACCIDRRQLLASSHVRCVPRRQAEAFSCRQLITAPATSRVWSAYRSSPHATVRRAPSGRARIRAPWETSRALLHRRAGRFFERGRRSWN
jgi:hypothetical protein